MKRARAVSLAAALACAMSCSRASEQPAGAAPSSTDHVVIITVDTLRADRVGAYGYARASTPTLDALAKSGARFDRAYAAAPITQTSHATLLTGRYPQGHGARHNGIRINDSVPTLAERFRAFGFATGAFVAAFPLDKRFGLARGFDAYGDTMPGDANGRALNERPGRVVVDEAIAWLGTTGARRVFLWVHLFEPHAPYQGGYDAEIAEADRQIGRLLGALGDRRAKTLIVATSDHGEAFGEHGEIGHSMFLYDTTLRVPLVIAGPGVPAGVVVDNVNAGLVDVAPTVMARAGLVRADSDGLDLSPRMRPRTPGVAEATVESVYYAETFAPLLDFGWSPLRSVRFGGAKYIEAPRPEYYNIDVDRAERANRFDTANRTVASLQEDLKRLRGADTASPKAADPDGRLSALGYIGASPSSRARNAAQRPDPKDKIKVAAAIARITSGEARGAELEQALRAVLAEDPANPQMNLRLGYVLAESSRCPEARRRFDAAIRGKAPTADAHLGLASCQAEARQFDAAIATLREAARVEPGNPIVTANIGLVLADAGRPADAVAPLRDALAASPDLHQARFGLAVALARLNRRDEARAEATELLRRLPPSAPQRAEVQRLISALSSQ